MLKRYTLLVGIWIAVLILWTVPASGQTPSVVSTSPAQNALNVPTNTNISVTFDIDMDSTSINDSTFVVNAWSTGLHQGTITYDSLTKAATLDPTKDFDEGEIVTVTLTTGIKSSVGTPMESSYAWSSPTKVDDGTACLAPAVNYGAGDGASYVFCADLDGDGDLDLAVTNTYRDSVSILFNIRRGDCNRSGIVDLGDVVYLITYLYKSAPAPNPLSVGDVNCNGVVDLGEVVYLISYLYKSGPAPCC